MSHRLVYVIMNFPVGGRPYVETIFKANQFLTKLFTEIQNEGSYLSKPNLERLDINFPCDPRYKMFAYNMPMDFMKYTPEPTGYSYTDYMREKYLEKLDKKNEAAAPPKLE